MKITSNSGIKQARRTKPPGSRWPRGLTEPQAKFAWHLVMDSPPRVSPRDSCWSAAEAARRAGYSEKSARDAGYKLLRSVAVRAEIRRLAKRLDAETRSQMLWWWVERTHSPRPVLPVSA